MIGSVLVPLDGSPLAERALECAVAIAKGATSRLHLATVRREIPIKAGPTNDVERLYLERIAGIAAEQLATPPRTALLADVIAGHRLGSPPRRAVADALEDYVRAEKIDLTVMTTHGRGGLTRIYMGSVADAFIRYSPAPVMVFRPSGQPIHISHLLVLFDGSAEAETIVGPAIDLARALNARCTLLRVIQEGVGTYDALQSLTRICERFAAAGIEAAPDVRRSENPAAAILVYCVTNSVDAIALTTRTRNPLQRMFLGSVADVLVRKSGRPVLISNPFAPSADLASSHEMEVAHER